MLIASLGSGSAGNCCLVEADGTRILVDAGFGIRTTQQRLKLLDRQLDQVDAILITHEHSDHVHGAAKISSKFEIPVHLTRGTLEASRLDERAHPVKVVENDSTFRVGNLEVRAVRIVHDAADPACYVIESGDGTRAAIVSDLGCVEPALIETLRGCDILLFEANHDLDMLRTGSYPWSLKRRILSRHGHLSNDDAFSALGKIADEQLRHLCLIHLSEKNNHESIVRPMAEEFVGRIGAPIELQVASQHHPMAPIELVRKPETRAAQGGQMLLW